MAKNPTADEWIAEFHIQTSADLDFVISHNGWPIGMMSASPAEFKRRVLAAGISYQLALSSVDYTLKRYVEPNTYEDDATGLGDAISIGLRECAETLKDGLKDLHTRGEMTFGQVGAEVTLFKIPETFDLARMLANRGLFLEVLPVLRLCLEMAAWSAAAFFIADEKKIVRLKAQTCIQKIKLVYKSAGKLYGYFSKFAHWEFGVHAHFLKFENGQTAVISASCQYRAKSLLLCLVILDLILEVVRHIYGERAASVIAEIQSTPNHVEGRRVKQLASKIVAFSAHEEFVELEAFFS